MVHSRILAPLTALAVAVSGPAAFAGILSAFSGHSRTTSEAPLNPVLDFTTNYAVFKRTGAPGDVWGTGIPDFDANFNRKNGYADLDTNAPYLYLYQVINDGVGARDPDPIEFNLGAITSIGWWNGRLADNNGEVSLSNQFGVDGFPHQPLGPVHLGVTQGRVVSPQGPVVEPVNLTAALNGLVTASGHTLLPGQALSIIGVTSYLPPVLYHLDPSDCPDNKACNSGPAPPSDAKFYHVHPGSTYLRAADEETLPKAPTIIDLATATPSGPAGPGDLLLIQRVGDFVFTNAEDPHELPPHLQGPHADERPGTLRNMYAAFGASDQLRGDDEALSGFKTTPIPPSSSIFNRIVNPSPFPTGNAQPILSDHPSRFNRPASDPPGDPFVHNNMTKYQLTDIPGDFYVDLEGELEDAEPVLVIVPPGATHLFVGAGDGQFFDNRHTNATTYPEDDERILDVFGVNIALVAPGRVQGDFDGNGRVDGRDFLTWQRQLGQIGLTLSADSNVDGRVTGADLAAWRVNFGRTLSEITGVPTPEPATVMLALTLILSSPLTTSTVALRRTR
jgi:hypothetical protein